MTPLSTVAQVFDAIQHAKQGAAAYCTNFFPVQTRVQGWIDHGELLGQAEEGVAFFLRRDRDFWRFYFCAANRAVLERRLALQPDLKTKGVTADLVGTEPALAELCPALAAGGFRPYHRLHRLVRLNSPQAQEAAAATSPVGFASETDCPAVLDLLESSFDRYADQLPTLYELQTAIQSRQIYAIKSDGALAALLFFEAQGLTSVLRYWVVASRFRSHHFGSALIRHYFADQAAVRRFILWVTVDNENALEKYRHYGYKPDSLVDQVLLNDMIHP